MNEVVQFKVRPLVLIDRWLYVAVLVTIFGWQLLTVAPTSRARYAGARLAVWHRA